MNEALTNQMERATRLQHRLLRVGHRFYDPPEALLRQWNEFFLRFNGYTIGQNSLEYAILLLMADDNVYGIDNGIEGNRIIRRILEFQVLDPDSERYGNFIWMTHWDRVKDRNAVSFLAPGLAHAYTALADRLEDETKAALEAAFEPMLAGVFGHGAVWSYTNIWALNLGAIVALSRILDDAEAHARAVASFDEWLEHTSESGMHEYNSPTYSPVTMSGIEFAWAYTPDERFRARLERTLDFMSYQLAVNMMPNGFQAGAASRAYSRDIVRGTGGASYWAHLKFGTPLRDRPEDEQHQARITPINFALHGYVPPRIARELAVSPRTDTILDRTVTVDSRRTHEVRLGWSLASQRVQRVGGHSPSPYVMLVRNTDEERASVVIAPDETFTHRPCAGFDSVQAGARVLGRLHYQPTDEERAKAAADPEYICEPRVLFGRRGAIEQVRVGNVDWGGQPVTVDPGQPIAVQYARLQLGVIMHPLDAAGQPVAGRMELAFGDDDELRLNVLIFGASAQPVEVVVLVDARDPQGDLGAYAQWLRGWTLLREGADEHPPLRATHPAEAELRWPQEQDSLGDALHRSSALTVMPGDLMAWVNDGERLEALSAK